MMKTGVVFPQTEFGNDPAALKDYAQTAEALGYNHIIAYDHILGANPERPGGWKGPYTYHNPFHEVFVLFSFIAGVTEQIELAPGVLILPQRQTALAAKQAASLDVLSGGRLRLGIGIGWNRVEYAALGRRFSNRGRRVEEQVELMLRLWAEPLVVFEGQWHDIPDAGLNPLPVQRPIPIWFGGSHDNVMRRIVKYGQGWMSNYRRAEDAKPALEKIDALAEEAGRPRDEIGLEARLAYGQGEADQWAQSVEEWQAVGATHISINTMGRGFDTPQAHLDAIRRFAEAVGVGR